MLRFTQIVCITHHLWQRSIKIWSIFFTVQLQGRLNLVLERRVHHFCLVGVGGGWIILWFKCWDFFGWCGQIELQNDLSIWSLLQYVWIQIASVQIIVLLFTLAAKSVVVRSPFDLIFCNYSLSNNLFLCCRLRSLVEVQVCLGSFDRLFSQFHQYFVTIIVWTQAQIWRVLLAKLRDRLTRNIRVSFFFLARFALVFVYVQWVAQTWLFNIGPRVKLSVVMLAVRVLLLQTV
jgi:hypothetical protein